MQTSSSGTGAEWKPWFSQIATTKTITKQNVADPRTESLLKYQFAAININNGNIIPSTIIPPNSNSNRRIEDPTKDHRRNITIPDSMIIREITESNMDALLGLELPPNEGQSEDKEAIDMIEIRRLKMKKHQRRKWLKKYKYPEAKRRLRLRKRKEKEFQAELLAQIREAETFSPEKYVEDKLATLNVKIPKEQKIVKVF